MAKSICETLGLDPKTNAYLFDKIVHRRRGLSEAYSEDQVKEHIPVMKKLAHDVAGWLKNLHLEKHAETYDNLKPEVGVHEGKTHLERWPMFSASLKMMGHNKSYSTDFSEWLYLGIDIQPSGTDVVYEKPPKLIISPFLRMHQSMDVSKHRYSSVTVGLKAAEREAKDLVNEVAKEIAELEKKYIARKGRSGWWK